MFATLLLVPGLIGLASAAAPACTPAYGARNPTLAQDATYARGNASHIAQEFGNFPNDEATFDGLGELIALDLPPVTRIFNKTALDLSKAKIKCNTCKAKDGSQKYPHFVNPIVSYQDLEAIFNSTWHAIDSLNQKYCDRQGHEPAQGVKPFVVDFIEASWKAFGVGSTIGKKAGITSPPGAVIPYYNCLATYGSPQNTKKFEDNWFKLNKRLEYIYSTDCVRAP